MSTLMLEAVKITQSLASKSLFQLTHPRQHPYCVLAKINSFTARAKISLYDVNHESCENGANELFTNIQNSQNIKPGEETEVSDAIRFKVLKGSLNPFISY